MAGCGGRLWVRAARVASLPAALMMPSFSPPPPTLLLRRNAGRTLMPAK
jgi:hypothetical protein